MNVENTVNCWNFITKMAIRPIIGLKIAKLCAQIVTLRKREKKDDNSYLKLISISFPPLANFLITPEKMYEGLVDGGDWYLVEIYSKI